MLPMFPVSFPTRWVSIFRDSQWSTSFHLIFLVICRMEWSIFPLLVWLQWPQWLRQQRRSLWKSLKLRYVYDDVVVLEPSCHLFMSNSFHLKGCCAFRWAQVRWANFPPFRNFARSDVGRKSIEDYPPFQLCWDLSRSQVDQNGCWCGEWKL